METLLSFTYLTIMFSLVYLLLNGPRDRDMRIEGDEDEIEGFFEAE